MFSSVLLSWLMRASILLTIGWLVSRWIETRSATAAHRILAITFAGCLLIPVVMLLLPTWHWDTPAWLGLGSSPIETEMVTSTKPKIEIAFERGPSEQDDFALSLPQNDKPHVETASQVASVTDGNATEFSTQEVLANKTPAANRFAPQPSAIVSAPTWNWFQWLDKAWLAVSTALVLRLLFSLLILRRHVAGCPQMLPEVTKYVNEVAIQLGVKQFADVRLASENAMPMSCWLGFPAIVLPSNFSAWPAEHRKATLAHEFGHVVRRDAWADYLVRVVTCFLWLNPLVWWAAADVRRLRERACDEWVLKRSGVSPANYAECLLAVVRCCHDQRLKLAAPMAGSRDLETRLAWLMSSSDRQVMRPLVVVAISFFVVMAAVAIATGQPSTTSTASGTEEAPQMILSQDPSPATPAINVKGKIEDETGKPLADINVVLRGQVRDTHQYCTGLGHVRDVLAKTKTDSQGRFRFSNVGIPPRMIEVLSKLRAGQPGAQLLAWGPGKALAWEPVAAFEAEDKEIQLVDETKFTGTILGPDEQPMDGGQLKVTGFTRGTTDINALLDDPGDLNIYSSELNFRSVSRNGQFSLPNMPANVRAMVQCTGPTGEKDFILIDTGDGAFKTAKYRIGGGGEWNVFRSPATVTLKQKPWVEIRIADHTGKPVSGGGLEAITKKRHHGGSISVGLDGSANLIVNDAGLHQVMYVADPLFPAVGVSKQVDIQTSGSRVEFQLPKPIFIEGKVIDSETGIPIIGAYVGWGNREYDLNSPKLQNMGALGVSGKEGVFRLPILAGDQLLYVRHEIDGYMLDGSTNAVSVNEDGLTDDVVIKVGHGLRVHGIVTDDNGRPNAGAKVTAAQEEGKYREASTVTDEMGRYEIAGLSPTSKLRISTWSDAGAAHHVLGGDSDHHLEKNVKKQVDLKVRAGTTLTGRVVQSGKPVAGVTVKLKSAPPQPPEQDWTRYYFLSESVTDIDGRYRVSGLHKGERYELEVLAAGNAEVRDWVYSSPYVNEMKEEDGSSIELPDAVLSSNGQSLSGIVVDLEGRPVAGYTVSASLVESVNGMSLSRPKNGPPPWTKTDKKGHFHLSYLPEKPVKLMTYKANPKGGRIYYPTVQEVTLNDKEIRIVVDPKLGGGIEDLDK